MSLVILAALIVATRTSSPESPNEALAIYFQTYSNSPSGARYALFAVTNHDTCDLIFWGGVGVEFAGTNRAMQEVFCSLASSNLHPGKPYTMLTETPSNHQRWRLDLTVRRCSLKQALVDISTRVPVPYVGVYNNGSPDFFGYTTDWIPE